MKTITELNSKIWYRFLKVLFILLVIAVIGIAVAVAFSEVGSYQSDFSVKCNYGNKSNFLAYKDKEIYISSYEDYSTSLAKLSSSAKEELQSACGVSKEEINGLIQNYLKGTDEGKMLFELTPTRVPISTPVSASLWSLLFTIVIIIIAEIIRRAFYYIVLGSIRPQKHTQ